MTYALVGFGLLLVLAVLNTLRARAINRRVARNLVPGVRAMRKLAGQVIGYRPLRPDESIPSDATSLFEAARQELTANGLVVLGDLMEAPPQGPANPTRWFTDATHTVFGWFGVLRNKAQGTVNPVMLFFSEGPRDAFFITGRGTGPTGTAQPPTQHRDFFGWGVGLAETLRRHQAQITNSGVTAVSQPATLETGPALVSRLREHAARWRAAQPPAELLQADVRALTGDKFDYVGPPLLRLLNEGEGL